MTKPLFGGVFFAWRRLRSKETAVVSSKTDRVYSFFGHRLHDRGDRMTALCRGFTMIELMTDTCDERQYDHSVMQRWYPGNP